MSSLIASNDFFDWFTNSIWFSLAERRLLTLNPAFSACSASATIIFSISSVDFCVSSASCLICCATTAKPAPASPALAASMLALSARSAVCLSNICCCIEPLLDILNKRSCILCKLSNTLCHLKLVLHCSCKLISA